MYINTTSPKRNRFQCFLAILASLFRKQPKTAAKQRAISLFCRWPNRRRARISAEDARSAADNFRQKQQKQREPQEPATRRLGGLGFRLTFSRGRSGILPLGRR